MSFSPTFIAYMMAILGLLCVLAAFSSFLGDMRKNSGWALVWLILCFYWSYVLLKSIVDLVKVSL